MKKSTAIIIITIVLLVCSLSIFATMKLSTSSPDKGGHVLTELWSEFEAAVKADRPQQQMEILDKIATKAKEGRINWDFYEAVTKKVEVGCSINWKDYQKLKEEYSNAITLYNEPIVSLYYSMSEHNTVSMDNIIASSARLQAGKNSAFYAICDREMPTGVIDDDYEFALWSQFPKGNNHKVAMKMLEEYLGDKWPNAALLEYFTIGFTGTYFLRDDEPDATFQEYAKKYAGKSVSLLAQEELLKREMSNLDDKEAGSDEYSALYNKCEQFEKFRKSFRTGKDKVIADYCNSIPDLMQEMKSQDLQISFENDSLSIAFRNVSSANIVVKADSLESKKTILSQNLSNPKKSFYAWDIVKVPMPDCNDGTYVMKASSGKVEATNRLIMKRLSLAVRQDSKNQRFYVADAKTGEPVDAVKLTLQRSGKTVVESKLTSVDGFTIIPEEIMSKVEERRTYELFASRVDSKGFTAESPSVYFSSDETYAYTSRDNNTAVSLYGRIFTDKSAYNPGETVHFKALLFSGNPMHSFEVVEKGTKFKISLFDADSKEVGSYDLLTNDYGTAAGEFLLPKDSKNGDFSLVIRVEGRHVESTSIVVDEFKLPTFDLQFLPENKLIFPGDTIVSKGVITSFSGNSLSSAAVRYKAENNNRELAQGDVKVNSDGTFSIVLPTTQSTTRYVQLTVTVTDATGETLEFSKYIQINYLLDLEISLKNSERASLSMGESFSDVKVLSQKQAVLSMFVRNDGQNAVKVNYVVKDQSEKVVFSGTHRSGEDLKLNLEKSGIYVVEANAEMFDTLGNCHKAKAELKILVIRPSDKAIVSPIEHVFMPVGDCADGIVKKGDNITVMAGSGKGPVWAVVELFGDAGQLLEHQIVYLDGKEGSEGSLKTIEYPVKQDYPNSVLLQICYFKNGSFEDYSTTFRVERVVSTIPLAFSSFTDKSLPGKKYSVKLKTAPNVEAVATVFDAASEEICDNLWPAVRLNAQYDPAYVRINHACGTFGDLRANYGTSGIGAMDSEMMSVEFDVAEPRLMAKSVMASESVNLAGGSDVVAPRVDFSTTLAFEPFLRSDSDGNIAFDFKTSDKLSSFIVQVFAHNKQLANQSIRDTFVVSLPVNVSVVEPDYLYKGDKYVLHTMVSNTSAKEVRGKAKLYVYPSADWKNSKAYSVESKDVVVPVGESAPLSFDVNLSKISADKSQPEQFDVFGNRIIGDVGLKVVFEEANGNFSDAVFVSVPLREAGQTVTEAHSAVLLAGQNKSALIRSIESQFTGTTAHGATRDEIDIKKMLIDAIPSSAELINNDLLTLTEAFYVRKVAASLGAQLTVAMSDDALYEKILDCLNSDGGFAWFAGMKSSPIITSVVLERFAKLRDAGLFEVPDLSSSVKYLDAVQVGKLATTPYWCGYLSVEQYSYIRSLYPEVPFKEKGDKAKELKENVQTYLLPKDSDGRGYNGQILSKARRIKTLLQLLDSPDGKSLASSFGIKFDAVSKMEGSLEKDAISLLEYAVRHRDGGWYYPNAVMPWRGLLESELYAHSMLCDLLSSKRLDGKSVDITKDGSTSSVKANDVANGIRLWIMLQKETQKWETDPAFVDAIASVMAGGEDILSTRVITLTKTYRRPFNEIVAAGNGFKVERKFYKESHAEEGKITRAEITNGALLKVGDKVIIDYKIWNAENRSFVKLTSPREACFRPVQQLSGIYGWGWGVLRIDGGFSVMPQGYRNVKADRTEYYFDILAEESCTVTEEMFVTQEGLFSAPVLTIESLYAPHYRANSPFFGPLTAQ